MVVNDGAKVFHSNLGFDKQEVITMLRSLFQDTGRVVFIKLEEMKNRSIPCI